MILDNPARRAPCPQAGVERQTWQREIIQGMEGPRRETGECRRSHSPHPQRAACSWRATSHIGSNGPSTCGKARMASGGPPSNCRPARTFTVFSWTVSGAMTRSAHRTFPIRTAVRTRSDRWLRVLCRLPGRTAWGLSGQSLGRTGRGRHCSASGSARSRDQARQFCREPDYQQALQLVQTVCQTPDRLPGLARGANHISPATANVLIGLRENAP